MKLRLLVIISTVASLTSFAQQNSQQLAEAELPSLLTIYKDIHSHPELSTQEQRTAALFAKELKECGTRKGMRLTCLFLKHTPQKKKAPEVHNQG